MKDKKRLTKVIVTKMADYCGNICHIMSAFNNDYNRYVSDIIFQYSCNMCVLQIGELTARLSDEFKAKYPEIPWKQIKALRNIHAHQYDEVDFTIMWDILQVDIPKLLNSLHKILEELTANETEI